MLSVFYHNKNKQKNKTKLRKLTPVLFVNTVSVFQVSQLKTWKRCIYKVILVCDCRYANREFLV